MHTRIYVPRNIHIHITCTQQEQEKQQRERNCQLLSKIFNKISDITYRTTWVEVHTKNTLY